MELFITLVKDFEALTNVTKNFISDVAESLDLPLNGKKRTYILKKLQLFTIGLFKHGTPFVTTTQPAFTCSKLTIETLEKFFLSFM